MVVAERIKTCYFCGNDRDLKPLDYMHVGGSGPVMQYQCQNEQACKQRQEQANKEWQQAMGIKES